MIPNSETRSWFLWPALAVSALVLAALIAVLVIGFTEGIRGSGPARLYVVLYTLVASQFWLLGLLIALARPDETTIRFGFAGAAATALQLGARALDPVLAELTPAEFAFSRLLFLTSPLNLAFAMEFFYRFPDGPIPGRFWKVLRGVLWTFAATVWIIRAPRIWSWAFGGPALNNTWVWPLEQSAIICLIAALTGAIIVNYRRLSGPGQRRRLQWIVAGVALATVPQLFVGLSVALGADFGLDHPVVIIAELMGVLIPLTMIYAILRHRTLGLQVVLRQSLQYLLARSVLRILIALPLVILVVDLIIHRNETLAQLLAHNIAAPVAIAAAAVGLYRRERLSRWLDRQFFREAHDREQLLVELVDRMRSLDSVEAAPQLIISSIETAFHPRTVRLFLTNRGGSGLTLAYSAGDSTSDSVPPGAHVSEALAKANAPVDVSLLPPDEAAWMSGQQAILAIPLASEAGLMGLLLLGEKKSEEPYTAKDRDLLSSIASQAAVIYENEHLKSKLDDERRIKHDVLARLGASDINLVKECPACGTCYDAKETHCTQHSVELTLAVPVERLVAARYRLDHRLGRGAMGTVYLAFDERLQRRVAVKVMMGSLFGNRAAIRRFEREARAAAKLSHTNIVGVHDYGAIGSDGAYLVMEHVAGITWRAALQNGGVFAPQRAAHRMNQLMEGVKAAHQAGLVHRDLKPENIMIGDSEHVKILDFGLAKFARDMSQSIELTVAGSPIGTPGYMSYEQLNGEEADERTDIFALGVIAAEAVTGRRPFDGRNLTEVAAAMFQAQSRLPEDPALKAVIVRCVAQDPNDRFETVAQLQHELIPALRALAETRGSEGEEGASTLTLGT